MSDDTISTSPEKSTDRFQTIKIKSISKLPNLFNIEFNNKSNNKGRNFIYSNFNLFSQRLSKITKSPQKKNETLDYSSLNQKNISYDQKENCINNDRITTLPNILKYQNKFNFITNDKSNSINNKISNISLLNSESNNRSNSYTLDLKNECPIYDNYINSNINNFRTLNNRENFERKRNKNFEKKIKKLKFNSFIYKLTKGTKSAENKILKKYEPDLSLFMTKEDYIEILNRKDKIIISTDNEMKNIYKDSKRVQVICECINEKIYEFNRLNLIKEVQNLKNLKEKIKLRKIKKDNMIKVKNNILLTDNIYNIKNYNK